MKTKWQFYIKWTHWWCNFKDRRDLTISPWRACWSILLILYTYNNVPLKNIPTMSESIKSFINQAVAMYEQSSLVTDVSSTNKFPLSARGPTDIWSKFWAFKQVEQMVGIRTLCNHCWQTEILNIFLTLGPLIWLKFWRWLCTYFSHLPIPLHIKFDANLLMHLYRIKGMTNLT
jgi:hypothetical protein